jgi:hypothetical protein
MIRPEEENAGKFLLGLGLDVHHIPTSSSKTPEFEIDGDGRGYVVEVKARKDSKAWDHALDRGEAAHQVRSMGHARWTQDVAHAAVKQLRSVDTAHERWWILWLAIMCRSSSEAMLEEAIGSLFGIRQVVYHDPNSENAQSRNCLFATPGVFERHPEIVACIVDSGSGLSFCVNDQFAADFDSFRQSLLWSSFARIHPPMTASDLEEKSGFFRVHPSVNRADLLALASHLERVYALDKAIVLDMRVHSASGLAKRQKHINPKRPGLLG